MDRTAVALAFAGALVAAAIAVDVVGLPPASLGEPAWYALVAVCLGFWVAMVGWASGR